MAAQLASSTVAKKVVKMVVQKADLWAASTADLKVVSTVASQAAMKDGLKDD